MIKRITWHPITPLALLALQFSVHVRTDFQKVTWVSVTAFVVTSIWLLLALINAYTHGRFVGWLSSDDD